MNDDAPIKEFRVGQIITAEHLNRMVRGINHARQPSARESIAGVVAALASSSRRISRRALLWPFRRDAR